MVPFVSLADFFITWAKRQVKDSPRSGMSQSCLNEKSVSFGLSRLFDEVRTDLVRDISRSLPVL